MTDVGVPDAVVNSPAGMAFLERVGKPVYETLRALCLNRARQRSSLEAQLQVKVVVGGALRCAPPDLWRFSARLCIWRWSRGRK